MARMACLKPALEMPAAPTSRQTLRPPRHPRGYCGDNLEQPAKLPDACVDLIYIDPPFNPNRNHEIFWPETNE